MRWDQAPAHVRASVEDWLGVQAVEAQSQSGGFSPGVAARLVLADGRRAFVKAVGPELNPDSPGMHRREAQIVAALPAHAPVPGLLWWTEDARTGWVTLLFEDVVGTNPAQPWRADELGRVVASLVAMSTALTPSPVGHAIAGEVRTFAASEMNGWATLLAGDPARLEGLDDWSRRHLPALAELEAAAPEAMEGDTLVHLDMRADNLILGQDAVWVVDWAHARIGAGWIDLLGMAPSVTMQGGPPPEALLARHPAARAADPTSITAAVASLAGYFANVSLQPAPQGLPTVRAFQAAQSVIACEWLMQRTGWT